MVVSVPLRGVGCFHRHRAKLCSPEVSVPLRGVGCFIRVQAAPRAIRGFRPLAGCGLFLELSNKDIRALLFPSPCGVWVVSRIWQ